jgi:3-hydroxyacyl-[acyl-carrier-protein] dehydratase
MLENEYYTIIDKGPGGIFRVAFNPKSRIFSGHFPGRPVCPGVCSIEIILECCEKTVNRKLRLADVGKCRFTHLATPQSTPQISVGLDITQTTEGCEIRAKMYQGDTVYVDFTGTATWR